MVYVALVTYGDGFGNVYETQVCRFYSGADPEWVICDSHNIIQ